MSGIPCRNIEGNMIKGAVFCGPPAHKHGRMQDWSFSRRGTKSLSSLSEAVIAEILSFHKLSAPLCGGHGIFYGSRSLSWGH